jgi:phytoene dehydrogenase-like protein
MPTPRVHDVAVVGAGHNGLVAAAYLARAGRSVVVLERRDVVGGACVTEATWPGYRVSSAAYVLSLLRPEIIRDLDLARHGLAVLPRNPSSFTPLPDGRHLLMGADPALNHAQIAKFSRRDAEAFPRYEALLDRVARALEPVLDAPPPDPFSRSPADLWRAARLGWRLRALGAGDGRAAFEILLGAARPILDRWFESEALKATLATDAIIGAMASPSTPGTAYVLFHHVMGEVGGARGVWGYVRGGMGEVSRAVGDAARAAGATIRTGAPVERVLVEGGRASGVVLAGGEEVRARAVASGADAHVTFLRLLGEAHLPAEFAAAVRSIDHAAASLKINLALSELPDFSALPGKAPGPQHRGTIHVAPDLEYVERAYRDALAGRPSEEPILECTIPSVVDPSVAPPGRHLMNVFVQYAPYRLAGGPEAWDREKEAFADRCLALLARHAPNVERAVIHREVLSPLDLERRFALTGGNIFHGAMTPNQLAFLRPVPGWASYRTPVPGLYLCGSAAHPGGGVLGAPGRNAARVVLKDLARRA